MPWHDDPNHSFAGIEEKLKRSHGDISVILRVRLVGSFRKANTQLSAMRSESLFREREKKKKKKKKKRGGSRVSSNPPDPTSIRCTCGRNRPPPQIVSRPSSFGCSRRPLTRSTDWRWIEFPILQTRPSQEHLFTRYERKIEGVAGSPVRDLIKRLQEPYNRPDPVDSLLLIIHNFDVFDKHRELVTVVSTGAIQIPIDVIDRLLRYKRGVPGSVPIDFKREFEYDRNIVPQL